MTTLTKKEQKQLVKLGKDIKKCLECNINNTGLPCRTDRFEAVDLMIKYLRIHFPGSTNVSTTIH